MNNSRTLLGGLVGLVLGPFAGAALAWLVAGRSVLMVMGGLGGLLLGPLVGVVIGPTSDAVSAGG